MIEQFELQLPEFPRGFHLITNYINAHIKHLPENGLLHIFIKHTSAALTINENADPSVRQDFEAILNKLVPDGSPAYTHDLEGADDMPAHLKASLLGHSIMVPITRGVLNLGTWQGIYLCEFRNFGGPRTIVLTIYK
jgi:secondary thiamine-phosphate synthase enzyme